MTTEQGGFQNAMYPEPSQATTALILGILSVVACPLLGPFAWVMGKKELAAIDQGLRDPVNRSNAQIGKILGIVGTAILGIVLLLAVAWVFLVVLVTVGGTQINETFSEIASAMN